MDLCYYVKDALKSKENNSFFCFVSGKSNFLPQQGISFWAPGQFIAAYIFGKEWKETVHLARYMQ